MSKSYWEKGPLAITNIFITSCIKGFKVTVKGQGHKGQNLNYSFLTFQVKVKVTGSRSWSQGHEVKVKVKNSKTIEK